MIGLITEFWQIVKTGVLFLDTRHKEKAFGLNSIHRYYVFTLRKIAISLFSSFLSFDFKCENVKKFLAPFLQNACKINPSIVYDLMTNEKE